MGEANAISFDALMMWAREQDRLAVVP